MLVAVALFVYYFVAPDSKASRAVLPWALLIAAISSGLLVIWVIIYISFIYRRDRVYVKKWDKDTDVTNDFRDPEEDNRRKNSYTRESKSAYIIGHILSPLINGLAYLLFYFTTQDWVKRHEN